MELDIAKVNKNTMKLLEHLYKALEQRDQYKKQRDELIEDIQAHRDLLKEFSKFIHRKVEACPGKAEYIDFRDSLKKLGITERE